MSNFIPESADDLEIEAVFPPIYSKEDNPMIIKEIRPIVKQDVKPIIHKEVIPIIQTKIQPIIHKTIQPVIRKEIQPIITRQIQKVIRKEIQPVVHQEIQPIIHKEVQPKNARKIQTDIHENIQPVTINHPNIINNNNHYSVVSKLKYDLNEAKIIIQQQKDVIIKLENKLNNKENINDIIKSLKYEIESKNKELIELK